MRTGSKHLLEVIEGRDDIGRRCWVRVWCMGFCNGEEGDKRVRGAGVSNLKVPTNERKSEMG